MVARSVDVLHSIAHLEVTQFHIQFCEQTFQLTVVDCARGILRETTDRSARMHDDGSGNWAHADKDGVQVLYLVLLMKQFVQVISGFVSKLALHLTK